jgi:hypothetical protein
MSFSCCDAIWCVARQDGIKLWWLNEVPQRVAVATTQRVAIATTQRVAVATTQRVAAETEHLDLNFSK